MRANSRRLRLRRVEEAAWGIAVRQLTAAFRGLDEETAGKLVEEDWLGVRKEEEAFEGLVYWIKGCALRGLWGRELLEKIRLGVMEEGYLEETARGMVPEQHREWMEGLVGEALRAMVVVQAKATVEVGQLGAKALTRRRYREGGGGRRLQGHSRLVSALEECDGRMCGGSWDGSIRVLRANLRLDGLGEGARVGCRHWRAAAGAGVLLALFLFALRCGVASGERIAR